MPQSNYAAAHASVVVVGVNPQMTPAAWLAECYLPLVGSQALGVWTALAGLIQPTMTSALNQRTLNQTLWEKTQLNSVELGAALKKLAAVRLIKLTHSHDDDGYLTLIEMLAVKSPAAFLAEPLFEQALIQTLGQNAVANLRDEYLPAADLLADGSSVDVDFISVFGDLLNPTQAKLATVPPPRKVAPLTDFDEQAFKRLLANTTVKLRSIENNWRTINNLIRLYHLSEPQLVAALQQVADINGVVDVRRLTAFLAQDHQASVMAATKKKPAPSNKTAESYTDDTMSAIEKKVITAASDYRPIELLVGLKNQAGGIVTDRERYMLQDVLDQVPDQVLNVIMIYLVTQKKQPELYKTTVQSMIARLSQENVTTAKQAFESITAYDKQKQNSPQPKRRTYQKKRRVEVVPDWLAHPEKIKVTPTDEATKQKAQAELAKIQARQRQKHAKQPNREGK